MGYGGCECEHRVLQGSVEGLLDGGMSGWADIP